jgi:hypothetical protein
VSWVDEIARTGRERAAVAGRRLGTEPVGSVESVEASTTGPVEDEDGAARGAAGAAVVGE